MIDLRKYYFENIGEDDYLYLFVNIVKNSTVKHNVFSGPHEDTSISFEIFDTEAAILRFKELCMPGTLQNVEEPA